MVRGSCLCGAVRYEINGPLEAIHHCHCSLCRKAHGAAFSSYAAAPAASFGFTSGEDRVRRYRSSEPVERAFCSECGSNLTFRFSGLPDRVWVAAGSIDGDPGVRADAHMFVASKAPWHEITDALPQYPEYPPNP